MHLEIINKEKYWTDLLWTIAQGDKSQYDSLKGTEVVEFFQILKNFEDDIQRKQKQKPK